MAWIGADCQVKDRRVVAVWAWMVGSALGWVTLGMAGQEWLGLARSGTVGRDWAWQEWHGEDRCGSFWFGRFGNHYKNEGVEKWYSI
jgi:hypothetical protein